MMEVRQVVTNNRGVIENRIRAFDKAPISMTLNDLEGTPLYRI